MEIRFGFANVRIGNKDLKVSFKPTFAGSLNQKDFEGKVKEVTLFICRCDRATLRRPSIGDRLTARSGRNQGISGYEESGSLSKLMQKRPHSPLVRTLAEKTQALKIMSLDMASSGVLLPRTTLKNTKAEEEKPPVAQ